MAVCRDKSDMNASLNLAPVATTVPELHRGYRSRREPGGTGSSTVTSLRLCPSQGNTLVSTLGSHSRPGVVTLPHQTSDLLERIGFDSLAGRTIRHAEPITPPTPDGLETRLEGRVPLDLSRSPLPYWDPLYKGWRSLLCNGDTTALGLRAGYPLAATLDLGPGGIRQESQHRA
jgi:hypothetical protein